MNDNILKARKEALKHGWTPLYGDDAMMYRIEYDDTFEGHHLLVVHHLVPGYEGAPLLLDWYCGYLEILPSDPQICLDRNKADDIFQMAPGGITLIGDLPGFLYNRKGHYVGFDTAHYGMHNWTWQDCLTSLQMMKEEIP